MILFVAKIAPKLLINSYIKYLHRAWFLEVAQHQLVFQVVYHQARTNDVLNICLV